MRYPLPILQILDLREMHGRFEAPKHVKMKTQKQMGGILSTRSEQEKILSWASEVSRNTGVPMSTVMLVATEMKRQGISISFPKLQSFTASYSMGTYRGSDAEQVQFHANIDKQRRRKLPDEQEVFVTVPERGKCYMYAEATRSEAGRYFTTNRLRYVGKSMNNIFDAYGQVGNNFFYFQLDENSEQIPVRATKLTGFVEISCNSKDSEA